MNFLALCKALRQEAGIPSANDGPTDVVGQTGEMKRIVDWINASYMDIVGLHDDWLFLRAKVEWTLTVGQREYTLQAIRTASSLAHPIRDVLIDTLRVYFPAEGIETESRIYCEPDWNLFRDAFLLGTGNTMHSRPQYAAMNPQRNLVFDFLPDRAYRVYGECTIEPSLMVNKEDVPLLPEWSHMIIVWNGLMRYAGFEESSPQYTHAKNMYESILNRLERRELPYMDVAYPAL